MPLLLSRSFLAAPKSQHRPPPLSSPKVKVPMRAVAPSRCLDDACIELCCRWLPKVVVMPHAAIGYGDRNPLIVVRRDEKASKANSAATTKHEGGSLLSPLIIIQKANPTVSNDIWVTVLFAIFEQRDFTPYVTARSMKHPSLQLDSMVVNGKSSSVVPHLPPSVVASSLFGRVNLLTLLRQVSTTTRTKIGRAQTEWGESN